MTLDEHVRCNLDHHGLLPLRFPAEAFALAPELLGVLAFLAAVADGSGRIHPACAARARCEWPYQLDALVDGGWIDEAPHRGLFITWVASVASVAAQTPTPAAASLRMVANVEGPPHV